MAKAYERVGHKLLARADVFYMFSHSVLDGCLSLSVLVERAG